MSDRVYCSESNGDEPMFGTADVVDVWLMLEYRPAWKAKALDESALAPATRNWIAHGIETLAASGLRARPQLIRQPEVDRETVSLLIAVGPRLLEFAGTGYGFLENLDLGGLARGEVPEGGRELSEARYFVCTNGQRDLCCARFGLPVYAEMRERVDGRAWQVSHLGGHRFAPNVLVLPEATLYGRVHLADVDIFVDRIESGQVSLAHLRGRTAYAKHVQAAAGYCGGGGLDLVDAQGDDAGATVTFRRGPEEITVSVERSDPVDVLKSCGKAPEPVYPYRRL
ncbi:MAG: hypothetical protein GWM88_11835 [Pseudomonadales bacterium]|nr:sucrase ferredoxin [Pseudomonadales bacterium]NIX08647.1 hypothetical protein [Pseudomonadales bacterium]